MANFYLKDLSDQSSRLSSEESLHAIKSLRLQVHEEVKILNGKGLMAEAVISDLDKKGVGFKIRKIELKSRLVPEIHIAFPPLKQNDRFEWFIEKATELGVNKITPLICERSFRKPVNSNRINRIMISAIKQSGNPYLPILEEEQTFQNFIQNLGGKKKYIAHCGEDTKQDLNSIEFNEDVVVMIGPEGDFTLDEIQNSKKAGFHAINLSNHILRAETAGIAVSSHFEMKRKA